jgi:hypothetical protein
VNETALLEASEVLTTTCTDPRLRELRAPGIFDQGSCTKWNKPYGRTPVPPLSKRRILGVDPATVTFFPAKSWKPYITSKRSSLWIGTSEASVQPQLDRAMPDYLRRDSAPRIQIEDS